METKEAPTLAGRKLLTICESEGITPNELARELGKTGSTIYAIIEGKTKNPGFDFCMAVCQRFDINANWLIMDKGPMKGAEIEAVESKITSNDSSITEYLIRENQSLRDMLSNLISKVGKSNAFRLQAVPNSTVLNASLYQ